MKKISMKDLRALTGAEVVHAGKIKMRPVNKIATDSRTAGENDIFFALVGEKFDAHEFIGEVAGRHAAAVVVNKQWAEQHREKMKLHDCVCVGVPDTAVALGELAKIYRRKFDIPVVAVAGSNGKTTTKEMITAVLSSRYNVLSTEGNFNNHIGVPQTLFRLDRSHDVAVVELGTNHFGELKYLCETAEPTHGVITNIGKEHLEFFGDEQGVAKEEKELFRYLKETKGIAFVNCDDPYLVSDHAALKKSIGYGVHHKADVRARKIQINSTGQAQFECVLSKKNKRFRVSLSAPGLHNVTNALAAVAVGVKLNVKHQQITSSLKGFSSASKRMEVIVLNGMTILNDTYNSNPDSVTAALKTLELYRTDGRKFVVLGDMKELGELSKREHTNIGAVASGMNFHRLFAYGLFSKYTAEAYGVNGKHFDTKEELSSELKKELRSGDVVLIKGSRGMKMEDVVNALTGISQQSKTGH